MSVAGPPSGIWNEHQRRVGGALHGRDNQLPFLGGRPVANVRHKFFHALLIRSPDGARSVLIRDGKVLGYKEPRQNFTAPIVEFGVLPDKHESSQYGCGRVTSAPRREGQPGNGIAKPS